MATLLTSIWDAVSYLSLLPQRLGCLAKEQYKWEAHLDSGSNDSSDELLPDLDRIPGELARTGHGWMCVDVVSGFGWVVGVKEGGYMMSQWSVWKSWKSAGEAMWDNKRVCGVSMCGLWKGCELRLNPVKTTLLPTMRVTMLQ